MNSIMLRLAVLLSLMPLLSGIDSDQIQQFKNESSNATAIVERFKRDTLDQTEIARQNRITQQIFAKYLERRLFPHLSNNQQLPTIQDILPRQSLPTQSQQPLSPLLFLAATPATPAAEAPPPETSSRIKRIGNRSIVLPKAKKRLPRRRYGYDAAKHLLIEDEPEIEARVEEQDEPAIGEDDQEAYAQENVHQKRRVYSQDQDQDAADPGESLQTVESEQHDQYFDDLFGRDPSENEVDIDCPNCVDESQLTPNKWTMPLLKLGEKRYYLGIFFKANWFKSAQYCRYHGMHLASISSQEENDRLEKHIRDFGLGHEHFWISGTDLADEGTFFWMATGRPITFTNWNAGEPNNFRYENGEEENCLELWNRDGKGLKWNDSPCSFETYFVCEV